MYRYSVDKAVTYTSEDIVLFRESPFACWMERLNLENPDHGVAPDAYSPPPAGYVQRQDELAATLRDEGKHVALIDWDAEEPVRRAATLEAMRRGTDYIVNGQLALGPLSGGVNLLMRTSGYSELGNYLYIPCDTQAKTTLNSAFRLCFHADLLHSLQGQLPPQMLVIRGDADLLPLHTEDHIYHYRAVKQRFMASMSDFRKHRMPDPAESSHFGRWSECAHELLKQQALRSDHEADVPGVPDDVPGIEDLAALAAAEPAASSAVQPQPRIAARGIPVGDTLAAQARQLQKKVTYVDQDSDVAGPPRGVLETALENLEFIGSSSKTPRISSGGNLVRGPARKSPPASAVETRSPLASSPVDSRVDPAPVRPSVPRPEVQAPTPSERSVAAARETIPAPKLNTYSREFEVDCIDDSDYQLPAAAASTVSTASRPSATAESGLGGDMLVTTRPFSSSLNTSNFPDESR